MSMFNRRQEKSFKGRVMLLGSQRRLPPPPPAPSLAHSFPTAPSSPPASPARTASGPPRPAGPARRGLLTAIAPSLRWPTMVSRGPTPCQLLRSGCFASPAFTPGVPRAPKPLARGTACTAPASSRAHGTGAELGAEQPPHWPRRGGRPT